MSAIELLAIYRVLSVLVIVVIVLLVWRNFRLRDERDKLEVHRSVLQGAASTARDAFKRYDRIHQGKNTPEGDAKAYENRRLAGAMDRALKATGYQELGPVQRAFAHFGQQSDDIFNPNGTPPTRAKSKGPHPICGDGGPCDLG